MRKDDDIDYKAQAIGDEESMIRLLCSPQYYDKETHIVSAETFNLRLFKNNVPETYVSLGREEVMVKDGTLSDFLHKGYRIWGNRKNNPNEYTAYGKFCTGEARMVNENIIEINPLIGDDKGHVGMFYIKSEDEYYKGPLPTDDAEIAGMLYDLADMIAETIKPAPQKK